MPKPIHITTPWATPEEWAKLYPISKERERELQALVDQFKAMHPAREEQTVTSIKLEKRRKRASAA
jgi:hypothetical protein